MPYAIYDLLVGFLIRYLPWTFRTHKTLSLWNAEPPLTKWLTVCRPTSLENNLFNDINAAYMLHTTMHAILQFHSIKSLRPSDAYMPGRRQAIIRANAGILLIRPLGTNFNEFLVEILIFSFTEIRLKVSSAKWRPFCLGLNVLIMWVADCLAPIWCQGMNRHSLD